MITDRVSIILGDKKSQYSLINKAVRIIQDTYHGEFTVNDLTSLNAFSTEEKECLRDMFSPNITGLHAWEHSFYLQEDVWKYEQEDEGVDYRRTTELILLLLNTSTTSIGEKVYTSDYRLIENLWRTLNNWWDNEVEGIRVKNRIYEVEFDVIEFLSNNLKTRVGDFCEFNFEFVKAFMEAKYDYHTKQLHEIITKGKESQS